MKRPMTQCIHCGGPTRSKAGVCRDCHVPAHPPKTRCTKCGAPTQRKEGVCKPCTQAQTRCTTCGVVPTSKVECASCEAAKKDDESPWSLEGLGYWRQRRGAKEWVPLLPIEDERKTPVQPSAPKRACLGCDTFFHPQHNLQRYHDERCRNRADYRRRCEKRAHPVEAKGESRKAPMPQVDTVRQFSDDECRDGKARYEQGDRTPITVAQNREYRRVMQAARRKRLQEEQQRRGAA